MNAKCTPVSVVGWDKIAQRSPAHQVYRPMVGRRDPRLAGPTLLALSAIALLSTAAAAQRGGAIGKALIAPAANSNAPNSTNGLVATAAHTSDSELVPPTDTPVLYLQDNDWLSGAPVEAGGPEKFGWRSPAFTQPFEFDLHSVTSVRFPAQAPPAWREQDYRLELAGGDILYGTLLSVSEQNLLFRSSQAGELRVKRSAVRCLERCRANALVYLGPNGLGEWQVRPEASSWHEDNGDLVTEKDSASLFGAVDLPARALVELEVSSLFPPAFKLALGTGAEPAGRRRGFRLEVVDFDVIAIYETESDIDVARVMTLTPGPDRDQVHVRVLLDQEAQRADVYSPEGLLLARVQVGADDARISPGIWLEHKRGGLRLERLRVWRWTGTLPPPVTAGRPQLHRIDGSIVYGKLAGYDAQRQFAVATDQGQELYVEDQVARIYFGEPAEAQPRPMRVRCADGTQLSGWFAGLEDNRLLLDCPVLDTPALDSTALPLGGLASIGFQHESGDETPSIDRALAIEFDGGRMRGRLAPVEAAEGQLGLAWLPAGSSRASPFRDDASAHLMAQSLARFEFARPQPSRDAVNANIETLRARQAQGTGGAANALDTIYLTTGDTFKCLVTEIGEGGVSCHTSSATKQIGHPYVKAIELARADGRSGHSRPTFEEFARRAGAESGPTSANSDREKIARLLTLPRLQRDDPPTHILCASNGDYLRGNLLRLADDLVRFSAGEREREFPRERIAAIVWLHDDLPGAGKEPAADEAQHTNEAHAVCVDGTRITFVVQQVDETSIYGASDVLGECKLPLGKIAELFIGERVRQATTKVAYHGWKLTPAPDPKAFQSNGESPAGAGQDSSLVGQPAPDFQLDLVDGSKVRLSDLKGRTVVLDFWASWCAPCVRSLPKLAETISELEGTEVKLVTINLQQSADEVKTALERMKLVVAAALDRDGAVAAQYGATAIPYTVVIAPDGKVARVFIGGGAEKQIADALTDKADP